MRLSIFVFLAALIISCNSSGEDPDEFSYPFTNQTWTVESGDFAHWIGVGSKAKAKINTLASTEWDTTIISNPEQYSLEIKESFTDSLFDIQFIDSTLNYLNIDSLGYSGAAGDSLFGHNLAGGQVSYFKDRVIIDYRYQYLCGNSYEAIDTLHVYWLNTSGTDTTHAYAIPVSGIAETVNHILCEN